VRSKSQLYLIRGVIKIGMCKNKYNQIQYLQINMTDNKVISFIKSSKWNFFNKLYPIVKSKYPNINRKHLQTIIANNITHDLTQPEKLNSKYFNKVCSNHRHSYQMDIFVNDCKRTDLTKRPYYLIFININTRFIKLIPINDKSIKSVLLALKIIIKKQK
jgi:hypothetical protein